MTDKNVSKLVKGINDVIEASERTIATHNTIRDKLLVSRALIQMGCVRYKEMLGEFKKLSAFLEEYGKEINLKLK